MSPLDLQDSLLEGERLRNVERREERACVTRYIDYGGVDIPITDRCPQHQAEREAQQHVDALSWPRIINGGER